MSKRKLNAFCLGKDMTVPTHMQQINLKWFLKNNEISALTIILHWHKLKNFVELKNLHIFTSEGGTKIAKKRKSAKIWL